MKLYKNADESCTFVKLYDVGKIQIKVQGGAKANATNLVEILTNSVCLNQN